MHYNRTDISKGIALAKSNGRKKCMICHYWFFNQGLEFLDYIGNNCHDYVSI